MKLQTAITWAVAASAGHGAALAAEQIVLSGSSESAVNPMNVAIIGGHLYHEARSVSLKSG
jgi:hypothetical protein